METTQQTQQPTALAIKDGNVPVGKVSAIKADLWRMGQAGSFVLDPSKELSEKILSFFYQCQKVQGIEQCSYNSIREAFKTSLETGIPVDGRGLAYLVKYGNTLSYHLGYKGLLYKIKQIRPGIVFFVGLLWGPEELTYSTKNGVTVYEHCPKLSLRNDLENIVGGFCWMSWQQNGREYSKMCVVPKKDIDEARKASKAGAFGPWKNWTGEMIKKVVLRRAAKVEFIGEPELEKILEADDKEYNFTNAPKTVSPVNYANVRPLEETPAPQAETVVEAESMPKNEQSEVGL